MMFVGREREISDLRGALGGGSRLVLVAGDAGIGKTRFVTEGLRGALSVWGACLPLTEKLPFLPVAEALDALSRLEDGTLLAGALATIPAYAQAETARLLRFCRLQDRRRQGHDSRPRPGATVSIAASQAECKGRSPRTRQAYDQLRSDYRLTKIAARRAPARPGREAAEGVHSATLARDRRAVLPVNRAVEGGGAAGAREGRSSGGRDLRAAGRGVRDPGYRSEGGGSCRRELSPAVGRVAELSVAVLDRAYLLLRAVSYR